MGPNFAAPISDAVLEGLWEELADIPFDDLNTDMDMVLAEDWRGFKKGTEREEIWLWFDCHHSRGVAYLLYELE